MRWIMGLGNPGGRYASTRHNVGFDVVDALRVRLGAPEFAPAPSAPARTSRACLDGDAVLLAKPTTYMNRSGRAAEALSEQDDLRPEDLLLVFDDADLELGRIRVRAAGGHGGHLGVRSVAEALGSGAFDRMKIGVRGERRPGEGRLADYVLTEFDDEEQDVLADTLRGATDAVVDWCREPLERVMNAYNGRRFGEPAGADHRPSARTTPADEGEETGS